MSEEGAGGDKQRWIWHGAIDTEMLNALNEGTLGWHLSMHFTEVRPDALVASMPVSPATKQPFGLLHGGARVALAETLGSVASWCMVDREKFIGVGVEINANHLAQVTGGIVTGVCTPIKASGRLHVWEIRIFDESEQLVCISRFTCMIVPRRG